PGERRRMTLAKWLAEPDESSVELPLSKVRTRTRRDFLLWSAGGLFAPGGSWWLLPDETRAHQPTPGMRDWTDTLEPRLRAHHDQVTRLFCVEGWSAIAWWGGLRFADLLQAYPPLPSARWAKLESLVNLDAASSPDPYYVSIDLPTARHPQTLLATHLSGKMLQVEHGAPLRLLAPMKLGLKNIKAITSIAYSVEAPADYWNERGYSRYDGL